MNLSDQAGRGKIQLVKAPVDENAARVQHSSHRAVGDDDARRQLITELQGTINSQPFQASIVSHALPVTAPSAVRSIRNLWANRLMFLEGTRGSGVNSSRSVGFGCSSISRRRAIPRRK